MDSAARRHLAGCGLLLLLRLHKVEVLLAKLALVLGLLVEVAPELLCGLLVRGLLPKVVLPALLGVPRRLLPRPELRLLLLSSLGVLRQRGEPRGGGRLLLLLRVVRHGLHPVLPLRGRLRVLGVRRRGEARRGRGRVGHGVLGVTCLCGLADAVQGASSPEPRSGPRVGAARGGPPGARRPDGLGLLLHAALLVQPPLLLRLPLAVRRLVLSAQHLGLVGLALLGLLPLLLLERLLLPGGLLRLPLLLLFAAPGGQEVLVLRIEILRELALGQRRSLLYLPPPRDEDVCRDLHLRLLVCVRLHLNPDAANDNLGAEPQDGIPHARVLHGDHGAAHGAVLPHGDVLTDLLHRLSPRVVRAVQPL
mmetsp:Transcript_127703/g.346602  ORF Transcript_127703/g.346602 Transcript_127703/m.346602 type:complete len:364 (+) Transcript_127703:310-1401(+)